MTLRALEETWPYFNTFAISPSEDSIRITFLVHLLGLKFPYTLRFNMVQYMIAGLLLTLRQMHERAAHLSPKPFKDMYEAYPICFDEAAKSHFRWMPLDYPKGSQKCRVMLVLWEHDSTTRLNLKKSNEANVVMRARDWLKERGVSDAENVRLVDVEV